MRLYWDGLLHEPSHDLRLHYKIQNTHAVMLKTQGFPQLL